jgi:hypothetical protein
MCGLMNESAHKAATSTNYKVNKRLCMINFKLIFYYLWQQKGKIKRKNNNIRK